jgi:hypothetical protein
MSSLGPFFAMVRARKYDENARSRMRDLCEMILTSKNGTPEARLVAAWLIAESSGMIASSTTTLIAGVSGLSEECVRRVLVGMNDIMLSDISAAISNGTTLRFTLRESDPSSVWLSTAPCGRNLDGGVELGVAVLVFPGFTAIREQLQQKFGLTEPVDET